MPHAILNNLPTVRYTVHLFWPSSKMQQISLALQQKITYGTVPVSFLINVYGMHNPRIGRSPVHDLQNRRENKKIEVKNSVFHPPSAYLFFKACGTYPTISSLSGYSNLVR